MRSSVLPVLVALAASGGVWMASRSSLPGPAAAAAPVAAPAAPQLHAPTSSPRCSFGAGSRATETLGVSEAQRRAIPIRHVVVVMQENRSFDHYFGQLPKRGQPAVDGHAPEHANPDAHGRPVRPFPLDTTCLQRDPPHQWDAMHGHWNGGRMDGFVRGAAIRGSDGHYAMGHYDEKDLPFYYWLANTFSISDRHFSSALAGTWHNRHFIYAATSRVQAKTGVLTGEPTIFDALDRAGVGWGMFASGPVRTDCIGWTNAHRGVGTMSKLFAHLRDGTLPPVAFVDPGEEDEHPPNDVQAGEAWVRQIYTAAAKSPLWPHMAIIFTYDEAGGFYDHVPPPQACAPRTDRPELQQLGTRVPLFVLSPWARPHHVSHTVTEHTSILRFIELLHDLPALSARDANASALLDMFDFERPRLLEPGPAPEAGRGGCHRKLLAR